MKIISFAWTMDALIQGLKTCTRRNWTDDYAKRFHVGDFCQAYNRSPRVGGKCGAIIQLTHDLYKEPLSAMTDEDEKAEGGLWGSADEFIRAFCEGAGVSPEHKVWVVRLELIRFGVDPAKPGSDKTVTWPDKGDAALTKTGPGERKNIKIR